MFIAAAEGCARDRGRAQPSCTFRRGTRGTRRMRHAAHIGVKGSYHRGMSDLQCPARLFVARHGDASYGGPRGFLTKHPGALTQLGRQQIRDMATQLRGERIAHVYTSGLRRSQESAELAAQELGVGVSVLEEVQEYNVGGFEGVSYEDARVVEMFDQWARGDLSCGFPDGETGEQIIRRYRDALEGLADLHRGEAVLVMSHGGVMSLAIPALARNVRPDSARNSYVPNAVPAQLSVDSDGIDVLSWPGTTT